MQIEVKVDDYGERGFVGRVVVDYQQRLNILNSELIGQLISALSSLTDNEELRVLILTGAGNRAFIGGADVSEMVALNKTSAKSFITSLHEACSAFRSI